MCVCVCMCAAFCSKIFFLLYPFFLLLQVKESTRDVPCETVVGLIVDSPHERAVMPDNLLHHAKSQLAISRNHLFIHLPSLHEHMHTCAHFLSFSSSLSLSLSLSGDVLTLFSCVEITPIVLPKPTPTATSVNILRWMKKEGVSRARARVCVCVSLCVYVCV